MFCKMAEVEDERYEDEETNDFAPEVGESSVDNHHSEGEQPNAGDNSHQESENVDATTDSDQKFRADSPSTELHPPGETPESTDENTVPDECVDKNSTTKDGEDERFIPTTGMSNLDRYTSVFCVVWLYPGIAPGWGY